MVRWLLLPLLPLLLPLLVVLEQEAVEEAEVERRTREAVIEGDRIRSLSSRKKRAAVEGEEGEPVALVGFLTT